METFFKIVIFIVTILGLLMYLIILGGNMDLSEQDRIDLDNEQSQILIENKNKKKRGNKDGRKNFYR
ncbi:MAG: hypothetical protein J6M60_00280 [Clostridia bacterium]|nr:hypothetical protein [Clostridia bacterium]